MPHIFSAQTRLLSLCLLALGLLGACNSSKYLAEDEYLVVKNKIHLAEGAQEEVEDWNSLRIELLGQISTVPNGNFFFIWPREWYYLKGEARSDTTRFSRFVRNAVAEKPAFLDVEDTYQSVDRIRGFMRNRGYFDATVSVTADTLKRKRVEVTYLVQPEKAYRLDSVELETNNPVIEQLLNKNKSDQNLVSGIRVDSRAYDKETARIVSLLRNNGFADFYANSISPLEADSSGHKIKAKLKILPPEENKKHHTYRIGKITVFPDSDPLATSQSVSIDTTHDGIRFIYEDDKMHMKPGTLADNIFFRPGDLFDQSAISKSNLQLNSLGVFRLVSIRQSVSEDEDQELDFYIQLALSDQWTEGGDIELSFTDRQALSSGRLSLVGPQIKGTLGNRNIAGGAEKLNLSADAGLDFNLADLGNSSVPRINTFEVGAQLSLELPRFTDFFGLYKNLNKIKTRSKDDIKSLKLLPNNFYKALVEQGKTNASIEARYVDLQDNYQTTTLSALYGFDVFTKPTDRFTINHLGLEYLLFNPDSLFRPFLIRTPFLARSLGTQVFTGFLFRNLSYSHISNPSIQKGTWTILFDIEQSGLELFGVNKLRNAVSSSNGVITVGSGLDYARYGRLAFSVAYRKQVGARQEIAARVNTGTALTYGFDDRDVDVPYVRQFFGGGNSSLRGWQARDIGPGSYIQPPVTNTIGFINFQQANFKFEANLEGRSFLTNIWSTRLDGAVFIDAGNIWTWKVDDDRPGAQFRFNQLKDDDGTVVEEAFYNEIAVNTGLGLRWDIGYVLFRIDMGIKLRNPYRIDGAYWPSDFRVAGLRRIDNFALGLNYPF
jgi:outer membrane protein assembly factor BamA